MSAVWYRDVLDELCRYCSCGEMLHSKGPVGYKGGLGKIHTRLAKYILPAGHCDGAWPDSVAVGLVWVLWRLLGGRGVSHAALGQWCAWSWVLVGSMWIGALVIWGHDQATWGSSGRNHSHLLQRRALCVAVVRVTCVPRPIGVIVPLLLLLLLVFISYFVCLILRLFFCKEFSFGIRNLASSKDIRCG